MRCGVDFQSQIAKGLSYRAFLDRYTTEEQRRRWDSVYAEVALTEPQCELLRSFSREMFVLCVAGAWCGDCINQCPIFARFVEQNEQIRVLFYDSDEHPALAEELSICGAKRVPSVLFLAEDGAPCGRYGDRTLSKYRQMVSDQLGIACPTGIGGQPPSLLASVTQDWLNEFERIQWMLRTSARLRQKHGD